MENYHSDFCFYSLFEYHENICSTMIIKKKTYKHIIESLTVFGTIPKVYFANIFSLVKIYLEELRRIASKIVFFGRKITIEKLNEFLFDLK